MTRRQAVVVVVVPVLLVAVIGAYAGVRLFRGDTGSTITVESLPTRTLCRSHELDIAIEGSRVAAFVGGYRPRSGEKLLLLDMTATDAGSSPATVDSTSFALFGDGGVRFERTTPDDSFAAAPVELAPGKSTGMKAAFALPLKASVGRLVYDDGCGHEEWIVP